MIRLLDMNSLSDAEAVIAVQKPAYQAEADLIGYDGIPGLSDSASVLKECGETFFGHVENEVVCGVISFKMVHRTMDIHRLVVHPDFFRRRIATRLLAHVSQLKDVKRLEVSTAAENHPAVAFYGKSGFRLSKQLRTNDGLPLVKLEKFM
ncbi:GNAT family N-acetyltransferase [Alteribacter natronophilus]|uniref:GNAT family N-acetyltransferase n=1 Tax=Alteribacter natronophilus TaxID=2583810 RepID=UPI00110D53ED|nr:GNAT family N-acetyltransferase [Alteribacter natronophilus]TMW71441.1 GNAT family N-acetyltransferase [Alteribacter natronophilus]